MDGPGDGIAENFRLPDGNAKHALYTLIGMVETIRPFAEPQECSQPFAINNNAGERGNKDECENNCFYHSGNAFEGATQTKLRCGWSREQTCNYPIVQGFLQ
jgi:hypothetical protein